MSCCHGNETLNDNSSALVALCMERLMGLFALRETFTLPHQSPITRLIRLAQVMVMLVKYHHTYGNLHFLSLQADSSKHICRIRAKNFISQTIKGDMLQTHTWHYLHVDNGHHWKEYCTGGKILHHVYTTNQRGVIDLWFCHMWFGPALHMLWWSTCVLHTHIYRNGIQYNRHIFNDDDFFTSHSLT